MINSHPLHDLAPANARRRRRRMRAIERRILLALAGALVLLVLLGNVVYGGSSGGTQVVTVAPGDTVWSIAAAHYPDEDDLRQRVDDILSINHVRGGALVPGQALTIPPP